MALWQAKWVAGELERRHPGLTCRLVEIKTRGDKVLDVALAKIGDKGLFTKEIENALIAGTVDVAVHSMKDLPTVIADGLALGAVSERHDPRDALIAAGRQTLADLPRGARVGTSSLRRRAQLLNHRPDLNLVDLRGNLETRLRKMEDQGLEAIILAAAGVERLALKERITQRLPFSVCLPAVGQGALGIEVRQDDQRTASLVRPLQDEATARAVAAERALMATLEGGCQIPIGALGLLQGSRLKLEAMVASLDGRRLVRASMVGEGNEPEALGRRLAEELLAGGAREILAEVRQEIDLAWL